MDAGLGPATAAWAQGGPVFGTSYSAGLDFSGLQAVGSQADALSAAWAPEAYHSFGGLVSP